MEKEKLSSTKNIISIIVVAFLAGGVGGGITSTIFNNPAAGVEFKDNNTKIEAKVYDESSQLIAAIEKAKPAVVSIIATKDLQIVKQSPLAFSPFGPFGFQTVPREIETLRQQVSGGSGFIIDSTGMIVTNKHVVQDTEADYTVVLSDGREFMAEVVSLDPANDLAIIQVFESEDKKPTELPFIEFAENHNLEIGQRVIAIGNALGEFQNTVTSGIISAESRQIEATDGLGYNRDVLTNLLQTDAAINQGNSGGPLINLEGQVVGINTAIASNANGIGFAIPIEDVKPVIESVKKYGKILRPQLGVRYILLSESKAKELDLPVKEGALLVGDEEYGQFAVIPGSPAEKAGLQIKDVILEVNGQKISDNFGLRDAIRNLQPSDEVKLKVWRSGKEIALTAMLEEFSE